MTISARAARRIRQEFAYIDSHIAEVLRYPTPAITDPCFEFYWAFEVHGRFPLATRARLARLRQWQWRNNRGRSAAAVQISHNWGHYRVRVYKTPRYWWYKLPLAEGIHPAAYTWERR